MIADLTDRPAVVTGAGSGIGAGLAIALARRGAIVVAADIEGANAEATAGEILADGGKAESAGLDVTDADAVEALAARLTDEMGPVAVLCNNAGVFAGGLVWESTDDDWEWVMDVNVRGIANGIRAFVPRMLASGQPAHVLNTASLAGMVSAPLSGVYVTSKFAAIGLTEALHHDLTMQPDHQVGTSVVVPAAVDTGIGKSERNRPGHLSERADTDAVQTVGQALVDTAAAGADPRVVAERILRQAEAGFFAISTNDAYAKHIAVANEDRLQQRPPTFQMYE
jgi:NAD(P)-dependent dehydrogenase (short-subunit alcohol dehydrogenase family)